MNTQGDERDLSQPHWTAEWAKIEERYRRAAAELDAEEAQFRGNSLGPGRRSVKAWRPRR